MGGSEKKASFSSPMKSSASRIGSDENDRSNQQMGLNLQKAKKQTVKTFMSPTVCAASKASFPRKKILAERNESPRSSNSSNTHLSKTPILDSKPSPSPKTISKASQKNSPNLDPRLTSKEPFSQKTPLSNNSRDGTPLSGPYDPLQNYLSPRPQFLRYNPNRRKEVFLRLEMEDKEGDDSLSVNSTASLASSSSSSSSSLQEDEEVGGERETVSEKEVEEFDTESDEEAEEEIAWSLRGVLKYFLLSVVLLLTTSYISTMNSPASARAFEGLTLGNQKFQNHSYGVAEGVDVGYKFLDGKEEQLGLLSFTQAIADEVIEEEVTENLNMGHIVSLELEGRTVESVEMVEEVEKDGKSKGASEEELIKRGETFEEFAEDVEENENVIEDESVKTGKVSDQTVDEIELQEIEEETGEQIEDVKENGESRDVIEDELVQKVEVSDQMVGGFEQLGQETVEEIEFLQGNLQESSSHTTDSSEKTRVVPKEASEETHKETIYNDMVRAQIIRFKNAISMGSAVTMLERWGKSIALSFEEVNPLKGLNQHMGIEIFLKVIFGFLTCAAIVASFVLGTNIGRKRIESKQSSLVVDKHSTKVVKEKRSLVVLPTDIEEPKKFVNSTKAVKEKRSLELPTEIEEPKKHVNSLLNTITLIGKDTKEPYQSRAPSVELLAEFEVGGMSNSLKSCAINSRMKDEQDFSELSTMNSNLSEGLTAKKKLSGNEFRNNDLAAGAKGEGRNDNVVTTPMRRSARIRNRSEIVSP